MKSILINTSLLKLILLTLMLLLCACTAPRPTDTAASNVMPAAASTPEGETPPLETDEAFLDRIKTEKWTGDIDGMRERRFVRALVFYNKTNFFFDGPQPRGITFEALKEFEKFINTKLNTGDKPIHIVFVPVGRGEALKRMSEGRADLAASNIPIVPELQKFGNFSDPVRIGSNELLVTGPAAPPVGTLDDLSGKEVFVRKLSRYWSNLEKLNDRFRQAGKPQMILREADENLEDEDILNMVNSGVVGITVTDDLVADLWSKVFDGLIVHKDIPLTTGDQIGWLVQKSAPNFLALVNEFVSQNKVGTSFGNTLLNKYLKDTQWAKNNVAPSEMDRFKPAIAYFKQYGGLYDFDWLMVAAQAYQESQIDQSRRSAAGAVGVMQIKPSTAQDKSVGIQQVDTNMQNNIHAGVKYMDFVMRSNLRDAKLDSLNRSLFALAAYNAGPARVAQLRRKAEVEGLNPNVWFNNVEIIAAREIGPETVTYVSNIYKYYIAYKMAVETNKFRKSKVP